jgi:hypothetical protein
LIRMGYKNDSVIYSTSVGNNSSKNLTKTQTPMLWTQ